MIKLGGTCAKTFVITESNMTMYIYYVIISRNFSDLIDIFAQQSYIIQFANMLYPVELKET